MDHGSTDRTVEIARGLGAAVLTNESGTIAGLRNLGTRRASGDIFVFLDADVPLTDSWGANLADTLSSLRENPLQVTGSWCDIPDDASWVERFWFRPSQEDRPRHLGTGHLITTRYLFERIGGFEETLETGEDYDFCRRAVLHGASIVDNPRLRVVHLGYPTNLSQFVKREIWHGTGDFSSLRLIAGSKVAMVSLLSLWLHSLALLGIFLSGEALIMVPFSLASVAAICGFSSFAKYRRQHVTVVAVNAVLYYFYFWGRALAFLCVLFGLARRRSGARRSGRRHARALAGS